MSHPKWEIIDAVGVDEVASAWRERALSGKKRLKMETGFSRSMGKQAASGSEADKLTPVQMGSSAGSSVGSSASSPAGSSAKLLSELTLLLLLLLYFKFCCCG